ncbi:hypothetical protein PMIN02_006891 [Paraphaeosphaeria minitans]
MTKRERPGHPPTSPVAPARMDEWIKLKQDQDNTRSEFERRVADARRQLLERHGREQQAFWTRQPPANANLRPVDQTPLSGPRNPTQAHGVAVQGQPRDQANVQKRGAAEALPPAAVLTRTPAVAQRPSKPTAKSQPPKPRTKPASKKGIEIVDLCSDDDVAPSRPTTTASGQRVEFHPPHPSSGVISFFGDNDKAFQRSIKDDEDFGNRQSPGVSNAPVPMNVPGGFTHVPTNGLKLDTMSIQNGLENRGTRPEGAMPSPAQMESHMIQSRQNEIQSEDRIDLNNSSDRPGEKHFQTINPVSHPFKQPAQQQKFLSAHHTLPHDGGQERAPVLGKTSERQEQDVDMEDAPPEMSRIGNGPNLPYCSHDHGGKLRDRQHDNTDSEQVDRDARGEYERQRQRFIAIMQANDRLSAVEQDQWIGINEAEIKRRGDLQRTLQNARALEKHNATDSDGRNSRVEDRISTPACIQGPVGCSKVQLNTATEYQRPQQASVERPVEGKQSEETHQGDALAKSVGFSPNQPSHQAPELPHQLEHFKVPQVPSRAAPISESTRREDTVTSQASSQTLPGHPVVAAKKDRPNQLALLTPPYSVASSTHKRKVQHQVSDDSDDEPEFEPPSSDDEPVMNRTRKPVVKMAKGVDGSRIVRPVSTKAKFGFKPVKLTKPNQLSERARFRVALRPSSPALFRRAKQKALAALDELFQRDFAFYNEEKIREADEREQRLKNTMPTGTEASLRRTLQRISLTPVPPSTCPDSARMGADGAHDADGEAYDSAQKSRKDSAYGLSHWTTDKMRGDRNPLKSQSVSSRGREDEGSEGELDISSYQWVNGRILKQAKKRDIEEMDMTDDPR